LKDPLRRGVGVVEKRGHWRRENSVGDSYVQGGRGARRPERKGGGRGKKKKGPSLSKKRKRERTRKKA